MTTLRLASVLAPALLLAACGSADPAESLAAVRNTEASQLESISAKDIVGAVRLYRDDAQMVLPDGTVLTGGEAIAQAYGDLIEDPNFAMAIEPGEGWASGDGDLAVVTSTVNLTTTNAETQQPVTEALNSQTVWTRANGAGWQIVSAYTAPATPAADPAATPAAAEPAPAE